MPLSLDEKKQLFIAALVFEFKASVSNYNSINTGKIDAKQSFVQSSVNTVLGGATNAGAIVSTAASLTLFGVNQMKDSKQAERRKAISILVINYLDTVIHDEIKKTAIKLSCIYHDFIEKAEDTSIKIIADCTAYRILNHMTKIADEKSELAVWGMDNLLTGAFLGRSGRGKQDYKNTAIEEKDETTSLFKNYFNFHAKTVEGLYEHGSFATKDEAGFWHFYRHKDNVKNPYKYGLVVLPEVIAHHRVAQEMVEFVLTSEAKAPSLDTLIADWESIEAPIVLTATQSVESLSEGLFLHSKVITDLSVGSDRLETDLMRLEAKIEDNEMTQVRINRAVNAFIQSEEKNKFWEQLHTFSGDPSTYHSLVMSWLNCFAQDGLCSVEVLRDGLSRLALKDYQNDIVLTQQEQTFFTQLPKAFLDFMDLMSGANKLSGSITR